ncbi:MAG: esterase family protein [Ruminococcus sp.]|nr:esterase family protein [Ruminococcus sp.]
MALLQVNFISDALKRTVPMNVILPVDRLFGGAYDTDGQKTFKTLYLLHGLLGNYTDWISHSDIQALAAEKNLAVVMPSGDNSFYVDSVNPNNNYGEFIGRELVHITRRMFPLSRKREDTFIAGFSMGGFGALRNGLKYYDTFGYIAALSSALNIFEIPADVSDRCLFGEDCCFGDLEKARETDKNPRIALRGLNHAVSENPNTPRPKIYMACGLQDGLIGVNRIFRDVLAESGIDVTYDETDGKHNWQFWNSQIAKVLDWLPLESGNAGLNSGNVR